MKGNRLQIRLGGPFFAASLGNSSTIAQRNRQKLSSPSRIFASILQVRQAPSRSMLSGELLQTCGVDDANLLSAQLHRTGVLEVLEYAADHLAHRAEFVCQLLM